MSDKEKKQLKAKNTEGANKRTETDFKEISGDIWQKSSQNWQKYGGVTGNSFKVNHG